jgi:hypothetical protein
MKLQLLSSSSSSAFVMASTHQVQVKIIEVCQVTLSLNSLDPATELSFPLILFSTNSPRQHWIILTQ